MSFQTIETPLFGPHLKGFPLGAAPMDRLAIAEQDWQVLEGDLPLPLAVLKRRPLEHNLRWMSRFCADRGLLLAPHGKTTMSPELWAMQLAHGAWGITFATVFQASIGVRQGRVERMLIANQVMQPAELDGLAMLRQEAPSMFAPFLVDSLDQVQAIGRWASQRNFSGVFDVLLEMGIPGGRTGCRTLEEASALLQAIDTSPVLRLVGVECYEGTQPACDHAKDRALVTELMDRVEAVARMAEEGGCFDHLDAVILTAGGSAIFDLVAERLRPGLRRPVKGILRSGCYITHDHQRYRRYLCCVGERLGLIQTLEPALEVICAVQSKPEPGLALLCMGRRDVSHDLDLPIPVWRKIPGQQDPTQAVPSSWRIVALNDQHAYLRYDSDSPTGEHPLMGELLGCGISHPCTTFDKWRWMPVVDDDYRVVDAVNTWF